MSEQLYTDLAALIAAGLPEPPAPTVLAATDGLGMFYAGQVNSIFGDPETGKTWVALAAAVESLGAGSRAAVLDLDHNGPVATVRRLEALGADLSALGDLDRFRYCEPFDRAELLDVVADLSAWRARVVVIDSLGELLPVFGASSNSPDEFTAVHAAVLKPLAMSGAAVITIDHLAKSEESRKAGPTGTAAKMRAVGGVMLRARVVTPFAPGAGGAAALHVQKDRHGGLRARRLQAGSREPVAGVFHLHRERGWHVEPDAPAVTAEDSREAKIEHSIIRLLETAPGPLSTRMIREGVSGNKDFVTDVLQRLVDRGTVTRSLGPRNSMLHEMTGPTGPEQSPLPSEPELPVSEWPTGPTLGVGATGATQSETTTGHRGQSGPVGATHQKEVPIPWHLYDD